MQKQETIVFYNVENLFDTKDDPNTFDDEFTPEGKKEWSEKRYQNKIYKISNVFSNIEQNMGYKPLFIGLAEVENKKVLEDLIAQYPSHSFIHYDSKDERGIDVALLYNREKLFITHSEKIETELENEDGSQDFTRDILYVSGKYQNETLHIFVVHFPSKRNDDVNKNKRIKVIQNLRKKIDKVYKESPNASIIIMGDMNESPLSPNIQTQLLTKSMKEELKPKELFNPFENLLKEGNYSLFYKDEGLLFDQIIISKNMLKQGQILEYEKATIFSPILIKEWNEKYKDKPFRTYLGKKYLGGYSDHFPVLLTLNINL